jgi:uncharacterized protein YukE
MSPLHIEPDFLHLAARTLLQEYDRLAEQVFALRIQLYRLEMAWQGGEAEAYLYDLNALLTRLERRMEELFSLAIMLSRQAEAWEECDQRWADMYRELTSLRRGE